MAVLLYPIIVSATMFLCSCMSAMRHDPVWAPTLPSREKGRERGRKGGREEGREGEEEEGEGVRVTFLCY